MRKQPSSQPQITVVVTNYNFSKSLPSCLTSIVSQKYKVKDVIIVDNHSTDNSLEIIEQYLKGHKHFPIRVVRQKKNLGMLSSYILGMKEAKTSYVITMHSDSMLPSNNEIARLVEPFIHDDNVVAAYPAVCLPQSIWDTYDFWQKFLFAPVVGRDNLGLNGKFDCFRKDVYLELSREWLRRFQNMDEAGGEDWDLHVRLKLKGKVLPTRARVNHLHYISEPFQLYHMMEKRRHIARTYGKLLKLHGLALGVGGIFAFTLRPVLALGSILPYLQMIAVPCLLLYSILYMRKMFMTRATLLNIRIVFVPAVAIFMVYYEAFWTIKTYIDTSNKRNSIV